MLTSLLASRSFVASGSELGFNFIIRPATANTYRDATGFNLSLQIVVIFAGLAAMLDVAAQLWFQLHRENDFFRHDMLNE
jgi:hypothetical protein